MLRNSKYLKHEKVSTILSDSGVSASDEFAKQLEHQPYGPYRDGYRFKLAGSINTIWLTQADGELHPNILPNLSRLVADAHSCDFEIVLWTNMEQLRQSEIKKLTGNKITVKDHKECSNNPLYQYFNFFLQKGIAGDKTAFALASDILRMAILALTPNDEYFIYIDPNDVELTDLKNNIGAMYEKMKENSFGFSFYVMPIFQNPKYKNDPRNIQIRNDVLLAHKKINPDFFNAYLKAYHAHLEKTHAQYVKPKTDGEAQIQANSITMSNGNAFFMILPGLEIPIILARFGQYFASFGLINVLAYLSHERMLQHSNTWLPMGDLKEEHAAMALLDAYPINSIQKDNPENISSTVSEKKYSVVGKLAFVIKQLDYMNTDSNFLLKVMCNENEIHSLLMSKSFVDEIKKKLTDLPELIKFLKDLGETGTEIAASITAEIEGRSQLTNNVARFNFSGSRRSSIADQNAPSIGF